MVTIEYKVSDKSGQCITKCPYKRKYKGVIKRVGSWICGKCKYYISGSIHTQTVECSYEDFINSGCNDKN